MIDKNGKLFGKINIIDLVIILFVIAALVVAGVFVVQNKRSTENTELLVMKFYSEEVSDFVVDKLSAGKLLYDDENEVNLGKITNVDINDSVTYGGISEGQYTMVNKQGYKSVIITGELEGIKNDLGAIISGHQYGVGHSMVLRAGDAKIYLRVYDISKKSEMMEYEEQQATKTKDFEIEFISNEVDSYAANAVEVGDEIYDATNGIVLGTVSAIELMPAKVYVSNSNGQLVASEKEGYNSVRIVGTTSGLLTDHGSARIDKQEYNLGMSFTMRAGNSMIKEARVTAMNIME